MARVSDRERKRLVEMAVAMQRQAGAAPDKAAADDANETRAFLRRLDIGYRQVNDAINDLIGRKPPQNQEAWRYINGWMMLFGRWSKFYADTKDDWFITSDDQAQTEEFGALLQDRRNGYEKALGEKPPGEPVEQPK